MRFAFVIITVAAIAVAMVHLRGDELSARHDLQAHRVRQSDLRRRLWAQQVRLGELTATEKIRNMAKQLPLELTCDPNSSQPGREIALGNK